MGRVGGAPDAARRHPGSVRRAGHHPHDLSRTGAADRRESGDVSASHDDALGAGCADGARLFALRRFVRVHPLRGRHRSVLGALARSRVPQPGAIAAAVAGKDLPGTRCDRGGMGLRIRAHRPLRQDGPVATARTAGLVPQVRAEDGRQRFRSRKRRRHGTAVPDRARPGPHARVQHPVREGHRGRAPGEPGKRRLGGGAGRGGIHGACFGLSPVAR
jgi:hypothetical protein